MVEHSCKIEFRQFGLERRSPLEGTQTPKPGAGQLELHFESECEEQEKAGCGGATRPSDLETLKPPNNPTIQPDQAALNRRAFDVQRFQGDIMISTPPHLHRHPDLIQAPR